jgi:ketosteroid isomerase-like protein
VSTAIANDPHGRSESDAQLRRAAEAYFAAVNSESWDELRQLFDENAVLQPPLSMPIAGRDNVVPYYARVLAPFATHDDAPVGIVVSGTTVYVHIEFEGKLTTGIPIAFRALDVFEFVDGRIGRLTIWYDSAAVLRDVLDGLAEPTPSSAERSHMGTAAEATPARVGQAARALKRGVGVPLEALPGAHWRFAGPSTNRLLARAVLIDLALTGGARSDVVPELEADDLETCVARQESDIRPGDVLFLYTGAGDGREADHPLRLAPGAGEWLARKRPAAVATDAATIAIRSDHELTVGGPWDLEELRADSVATGTWDGLLVASVGLQHECLSAVVLR